MTEEEARCGCGHPSASHSGPEGYRCDGCSFGWCSESFPLPAQLPKGPDWHWCASWAHPFEVWPGEEEGEGDDVVGPVSPDLTCTICGGSVGKAPEDYCPRVECQELHVLFYCMYRLATGATWVLDPPSSSDPVDINEWLKRIVYQSFKDDVSGGGWATRATTLADGDFKRIRDALIKVHKDEPRSLPGPLRSMRPYSKQHPLPTWQRR